DNVADNVNTAELPLDDDMVVFHLAIAGINVDQVNTTTAEDSSIDIVELLQSVI
ncbi:hypothetical protein KI387_019814, partial [Taxus chinensis]